MIRNYQRAGGATVDLVPVYNSLNALQNEVNSLITVTKLSTLTSIASLASDISVIREISSSVTDINGAVNGLSSSVADINGSVTAISTAFTSHTSLYDYKFRTLESYVGSSINSLSSSVMSINAVISTLSTATGGGGKTLTNPTESGYLFTDPVLYTGPDIESPGGQTFNNAYNTYLRGVTWSDYPSTVTESPYRTLPAYFGKCVVYGDLSLVNVYAWEIESCTVEHVKIDSCVTGIINHGSYDKVDMFNVSTATAISNTIGKFNAKSVDHLNASVISNDKLCLYDAGINISTFTINSLEVGVNSPISTFNMGNGTINSANINFYANIDTSVTKYIYLCNLGYLDFKQPPGNSIDFVANTVTRGSYTGGSVNILYGSHACAVNVENVNLQQCTASNIEGTASTLRMYRDVVTVGALYYSSLSSLSVTVYALSNLATPYV